VLFDEELISKIDIEKYYTILAYFMQINTSYIGYHQKIRAANIFNAIQKKYNGENERN